MQLLHWTLIRPVAKKQLALTICLIWKVCWTAMKKVRTICLICRSICPVIWILTVMLQTIWHPWKANWIRWLLSLLLQKKVLQKKVFQKKVAQKSTDDGLDFSADLDDLDAEIS